MALSRYPGGALAERLRLNAWESVVTSRKSGRVARLLDMLSTVISARRSYDVAIVEAYSGPSFLWAEAVCFLLRCLGKPYAIALHGGDLPNFARRHPGRVRRLLHSTSAVVSPSNYLIESLAWVREGVEQIPNPVPLERYNFRLREHLAPNLIWIRAFHQIYNPTLLPQVMALLKPRFAELRATMIGLDKGDGSYQATVQEAKRLGLEDRVTTVLGVPHSEVPARLNTADLFVSTTNFDNTPVSLLEAMACGLPVVTTNVGGIPFLFKDKHTAMLVPPGDAESMADAIAQLLTDDALVRNVSLNGRKQVESYDWPVVLPKWEKLLNSLITGSTRAQHKPA